MIDVFASVSQLIFNGTEKRNQNPIGPPGWRLVTSSSVFLCALIVSSVPVFILYFLTVKHFLTFACERGCINKVYLLTYVCRKG